MELVIRGLEGDLFKIIGEHVPVPREGESVELRHQGHSILPPGGRAEVVEVSWVFTEGEPPRAIVQVAYR